MTAQLKLDRLSFGDPTAEADTNFLFEKECFLETPPYREALSVKEPMFFVGRRGAGKSALYLALQRSFSTDSSVLCVSMAPKDFLVAHAKSLARAVIQSTDTNWEFLFAAVWASTLRVSWARALLSYYRLRDTEENDRSVLESFVADVDGRPDEAPESRLSRCLRLVTDILNKPSPDPIGEINDALVSMRAESVTRSMRRLLERNSLRIVSLLDGLDENWDGSNTSAQLLSGLLSQAAVDYSVVGTVTYAFIRENMYRRVRNLCPRWDRIEGYFRQLSWTREDIEELILKRTAHSADGPAPSWEDVFDGKVGETGSLDYMLQRTQFKPREMILFCRYALEVARHHRAPRIRSRDIVEAERVYSDNRLQDLVNEYQDSLPELAVLIEHFSGGPRQLGREELFASLSEFISSGAYASRAPRLSLTHSNIEAILDVLLGIGFLGVRTQGSNVFVFKYYGSGGHVFRELTEVEEFRIHPAFELALGLTTTEGETPIKEAGERDIVTTATILKDKSAAAYEESGKLLEQLSDIGPGVGGFRRYEELMLQVLSYAFKGYLDNPVLQERSWSGAQIRDIVFDNTGQTLFFQTIRNAHNAVTAKFECKNKVELEAADFDQIETRLNQSTGFLGFICYRSKRREPIRAEVDHLREIHNRDGRKVILLLTDAKVHQILEKRIKGKLDRFMYSWYTHYMRSYLT